MNPNMIGGSTEPKPKKKWTRAKVPRVKTGCLTCKARHLKCDEEKPECQRCIADKFNCDGYEQPKLFKPRRRKNVHKQPYPSQCTLDNESHNHPPPLRPALSPLHFVDSTVAALFYHARQHTVEHFLGSSGSLDFWFHFVLPVSHSSKALKYALCALGGAHQVFLADQLQQPSWLPRCMSEVKVAAIQNYNLAIMHMRPLMSQDSGNALLITMACCIIFICIENLHGRHFESRRHLRAGGQLLASIRRSQTRTRAQRVGSRDDFNIDGGTLRSISDILLSMRQSVVVYTAGVVFPNLNYHAVGGLGDVNTPFESLSQAESLVDDIEYACTGFPTITEENSPSDPEPSDGDVGSVSGLGFDNAGAAFHMAQAAYRTWNSRFELLRKQQMDEQLSDASRRQLATLGLTQAVWAALVKIHSFEEDLAIEDCEVILHRAQVLMGTETPQKLPVFSIKSELLSSLAIVYLSCDNSRIQRHAVALLRSLRRREGPWDSQYLADMFECILDARERNLVNWDDLPLSIPLLAKTLTSLRLQSC